MLLDDKQIPEVDLVTDSEFEDSDNQATSLVDVIRASAKIEGAINSHLTLKEQWKLASAMNPEEAKNGTAKWQALFELKIGLFNEYQTAVRAVRAAAIQTNLRIGRLDYNGIAMVEADKGTAQGLYDRLRTAKRLAERASKTFAKVGASLHWREKEAFHKDLTKGEIFPENCPFFPEAEIIREDHTKGLALGSVKDPETGRTIRLRGLPKSLGVMDGRKKMAVLVRWVHAGLAPQICLWEPSRGEDWTECQDYSRSWNLVFLDVEDLDKHQLAKIMRTTALGVRPIKRGYKTPLMEYWTKETRGPTPLMVTLSIGYGPRNISGTSTKDNRWWPAPICYPRTQHHPHHFNLGGCKKSQPKPV